MPFLLAEGREGMTPVLIPCSRSAHDQNVLARRPQGDQHGRHSQESETSKLGRSMYIVRRAQSRIDQATLENEMKNWEVAHSGRPI